MNYYFPSNFYRSTFRMSHLFQRCSKFVYWGHKIKSVLTPIIYKGYFIKTPSIRNRTNLLKRYLE